LPTSNWLLKQRENTRQFAESSMLRQNT
jgi:hypothetical protein